MSEPTKKQLLDWARSDEAEAHRLSEELAAHIEDTEAEIAALYDLARDYRKKARKLNA